VTVTLTELRTPAALLKAADAGEIVILTNHGKPEYELRKIAAKVDWDALEADSEKWLTEEESKELAASIERSAKVLTHGTVP
jgi:antitoxin (DNA-binding transcriptional repressor) of toxin-antitoxin stability system